MWVNPDCGLKTRGPVEVEASLRNLVAAAAGPHRPDKLTCEYLLTAGG